MILYALQNINFLIKDGKIIIFACDNIFNTIILLSYDKNDTTQNMSFFRVVTIKLL